MRIIITGASGFIGKNFLLKAPKEWDITALYFKSTDFTDFLKSNDLANVKAFRCNLIEAGEVKGLAEKIGKKYDLCLYLASNTDPGLSVKEPLLDAVSNVNSLINFLENFCPDDFIYFSSGSVYHGLKGEVSPKSKTEPLLPYAISKLAAEQYTRFYKETRKTIKSYIVLRFFGAYGPYEPERKIYSRLIKNFGIEKKDSYEIYGNGNNLVDAMYIEDAIEGLMAVINSNKRNMTVDFCIGNPVSIIDLLKNITGIFNIKNLKITKKGASPENILFFASNEEFEEKFNFRPKIPLKEGIIKHYNFLKKYGK